MCSGGSDCRGHTPCTMCTMCSTCTTYDVCTTYTICDECDDPPVLLIVVVVSMVRVSGVGLIVTIRSVDWTVGIVGVLYSWKFLKTDSPAASLGVRWV
jgi:hypothetical protein